MNLFPKQKLTSKEKAVKDPETNKTWWEKSIDYLVDENEYHYHRDDVLSSYRFVEGEPEEKDYNYVLNPFNTTIDRYKRFGAKLRNYNIIQPVLDLYAGEFSQRFKNVQVLETNEGDENDYKKGLNQLLQQYYDQQTVNNLNTLGIETGQESVEQAPVQEVVDEYNRGFDANRIITGQEILDYIIFDQDLDDKYQDAYMDWLIAGKTITYKGIFNDDIDFERVKPWEINSAGNSKTNFVEDDAWVVRRQVMTVNQIVDRWHKKLTKEDIEWLDSINNDLFVGTQGYTWLPTQYITNSEDYKKHSILHDFTGVEVHHAQWRSFRKVGTLTYYDALGQVGEMEVDDTYKLDIEAGDISIEWDWLSVICEGWRFNYNRDFRYIDMRELPYNRMELNNSSTQKLSYNGRLNRGVTGKLQRLVNYGRSYQKLYNVVNYQFEKIMNKNKDKLAIIPIGLIPKGREGWNEENFMYHAHANSYAFIDETSPTAALALQGIKVLDMSLSNFAKDSIELMQSIKAEWWDSIGMNRQRFGDIKTSDGKGTSEQAIFRSSVISDELNRKFEKLQEKDYEGLLDLSKLAYINGKKGKYINSSGREAFLTINPDDAIHRLGTDSDVHVKNSKQETEKIQLAKEYGFGLGQNADALTMLELIDASNFAKTKEVVAQIDRFAKEREDANTRAVIEGQTNVAQINADSQKAKNDVEIYKADKDYNKAIDVKMLDLGQTGETPEKDTSKMDNHKIEVDTKKLNHDDKKLKQDIKESNARIKHMGTKPKS